MESQYKVVYSGKLQEGFEHVDVVANLTSSTGMDSEKVEEFLSTGKPKLIKKNLTREKAEKYSSVFTKAGVDVRIVKQEGSLPKTEAQEKTKTVSAAPVPEETAKPVSESVDADVDNPYAAPRANLKVDKKTEEDWLGKPQKVGAFQGWHWIKEAASMFLAQPWIWVGMAIVAMLILLPINMIPFIGFIPYSILWTIFAGGLMLAAKSQSDGDSVEFSYLFRGFTHNRNQLIVLSLLYLGGFIIIGLVMAVFMGAGIWAMMGMGSGDPAAASAAMAQNMPMFFLAMLIGMALYIPLLMAVWFATPLVAINDQRAWPACILSLQGCLKNWIPFLIYGIAFLILSGIIGGLIAGAGVLLFSVLGGESSFFPFILMMIVMIVIGVPLMIIGGLTVFTSYRDIYYENY